MFAKLTALVGGGYAFPYNVEEPYPTAWGQWTHHKGTSKEDGSPVSVFKMSSADPSDRRLTCARNGVKRLKMLRHPNVLAFKDSTEVQEKGQTVIYLVTQPVKPLKTVLDELDLSGQPRDEYLAMGILHMTNAVSFINNDCKMIHGNICLDSVVVTETLDWKLHGFDLLSEHSLPADQCLMHASWMVATQYKPAELGRSEWDTIREAPPWAVDSWGLGCLMQEVFSQERLASVDNLRRTSVIPPGLLSEYQKLLSSTPSRRLNPSKVAECKFLNNRLVDVVNFMENIAVKDSTDKDSFFKRLSASIPAIPEAVAVRKILPLLSAALEFGGAPPSAVGPLLQIGNTLESDEFTKRVVPTLSKLFASPDRTLRRSLLESIDTYAHHFTTSVLEEQIFVHLQTGFSDTNAYIRELTLKSILSLAPKLTNKTLVNNVLKYLSRLQVDEEASIRANTTVLLGSIAKYLGESTCKRVLINAFTRALKDGFPPAKIAGLRALVATQQYHNAEDAALRILPAAVPLAIDPIGEVRAAALQVLETFTTVLKDADAQRTREAQAAGEHTAAVGGNVAPSASLAASAGAAGSSMLTWAVSSLMSSTGLAVKSGGPQSASPGSGLTTAAAPAPVAGTASVSGRPPAPLPAATSAPAPARPVGSAPASKPAPSSQASSNAGDGWGDEDDWNGDGLDDEEQKARARLSAASAVHRPAAAAGGLSSSRSSTTAPAAAAPATVRRPSTASSSKGGSDSWEAQQDLEGWEGTESIEKPAVAASAPRPAAARPRATAGAARTSGGGADPSKPKLGAMKLGASKTKLGVIKPTGGTTMSFDDENW